MWFVDIGVRKEINYLVLHKFCDSGHFHQSTYYCDNLGCSRKEQRYKRRIKLMKSLGKNINWKTLSLASAGGKEIHVQLSWIYFFPYFAIGNFSKIIWKLELAALCRQNKVNGCIALNVWLDQSQHSRWIWVPARIWHLADL